MSVITALIHLILGGRLIARPLLRSDVPRTVRTTHYFCWHMVTILLFAMGGAFFMPVITSVSHELPAAATGLAGLFTLLNIALWSTFKVGPVRMPQWFLFLVIAGLGTAALIAGY